MRGERYQNRMAILLVVLLVFVVVPLVVNLLPLWPLWAPVVASLIVLPGIFLRETDLVAGLRAPPRRAMRLSPTCVRRALM